MPTSMSPTPTREGGPLTAKVAPSSTATDSTIAFAKSDQNEGEVTERLPCYSGIGGGSLMPYRDSSANAVDDRHRMRFSDKWGSERDKWCVPRSATRTEH